MLQLSLKFVFAPLPKRALVQARNWISSSSLFQVQDTTIGTWLAAEFGHFHNAFWRPKFEKFVVVRKLECQSLQFAVVFKMEKLFPTISNPFFSFDFSELWIERSKSLKKLGLSPILSRIRIFQQITMIQFFVMTNRSPKLWNRVEFDRLAWPN